MFRDVATIVSTLLAAGALTVSIAAFRGQRRREDFELARSLHEDLTSGEVAQARDRLGNLVRSKGSLDPDQKRQAMTAYFTLLWCFERIDIGRRTLATSPSKRALHFLINSIRWHVEEWEKMLPEVRRRLADGSKEPDDGDSTKALGQLVEAVRDVPAVDTSQASGRG
ncbi:hypothetical protein ACIBF5_06805 [Micromonospora sp. NPDC050417]|uniref:hypothetical protein n=1 Tax=Micromonospora sp. NPDC050417 TaxID=3364280 RepID=UPI00379FEE0B